MTDTEDDFDLLKKILQKKDEFHTDYQNIGEGAFGSIYKVQKKSDNEFYALKCVPLIGNLNEIQIIKEEAKNLFKCRHQNIVRYHDSFEINVELQPNEYSEFFYEEEDSEKSSNSLEKLSKSESSTLMHIMSNLKLTENKEDDEVAKTVDFLCIQMELCEKSLRDIIDQNEITDCKVLNGYMKNICEGLKYLHEQKLIHRDLNPRNILLCSSGPGKDNGILKIADFGFSKNIDHECNRPYLTDLGTGAYIAPELYSEIKQKNNEKIDMYSLGVTFLEMNYQFKTEMELIQVIKNLTKENYRDYLPDEHHFILNLISKDSNERPTCDKVLDYLTKINISEMHLKNFNENRNRLMKQFNNELTNVKFENNFIGKIIKAATKIFELHGGKMFKIPCYYPHRQQSLSILNKYQYVVPIADNSRIVFAKCINKTKPLHQIRRYSIVNNLSNCLENMYCLNDNIECTFDIILRCRPIETEIQHALEIEIIAIILELINEVSDNSNSNENIVIHINYKAIIRGLLNLEGLNSARNLTYIYDVFRKCTNEEISVISCKKKLNESYIPFSEDLLSLLTSEMRVSQFMYKLKEYLEKCSKLIYISDISFLNKIIDLINLKNLLVDVGMKNENIFLNCTLVHQCEDSDLMFRIYYGKENNLIRIADGGRYDKLMRNFYRKKYFGCGISLNVDGIDKALTKNNSLKENCVLILDSSDFDHTKTMLLLLKEFHKRKINAIISNTPEAIKCKYKANPSVLKSIPKRFF